MANFHAICSSLWFMVGFYYADECSLCFMRFQHVGALTTYTFFLCILPFCVFLRFKVGFGETLEKLLLGLSLGLYNSKRASKHVFCRYCSQFFGRFHYQIIVKKNSLPVIFEYIFFIFKSELFEFLLWIQSINYHNSKIP